MPQLFSSAISINSGQVPSTQTDFPVLVSVTDARFKSTGNGGHVASSSGFDIRPYTDSTLATAIAGYELERYNASTGEVVMWVKVSSLSSSTIPIVLGYGDATLNTDGSSNTTWSNSFLRVYHLKDGTTLSLSDSTSNTSTLTNENAVTAGVGKIDGGAGFASASSQDLLCSVTDGSALTWSCWANATSFPAAYNAVMFKNPANIIFTGFLVKSTGKLFVAVARVGGQVSYDGTGSHTLSTATWYYLTLTYDSTNGAIAYVNAGSDGTLAASGAAANVTTSLYFGKDQVNSRFWNGAMDEIRVATVARSQDWITTEFNNQNAPLTFLSLGAESGSGGQMSSVFWD